MATSMKTKFGKVELLKGNPRTIRDNSFNRLAESIQRDEEFMDVRGIVVWQVPTKLYTEEGRKTPFTGQEGKLVILGGNQRAKALMALGKKGIPDEWVVEAKDREGNWWGQEKAERFIIADNSPDGLGGTNDYEKMWEGFQESILRDTGIDFSEFASLIEQGKDAPVTPPPEDEEENETVEEEIEKDEHGENNPELQDFISERERTRRNLKEIDEFGFYLVLVFESLEQKIEFIQKAGLTGKKGVTTVDKGTSLVAVFETFDQKMEFCDKMGLNTDLSDPQGDVLFGMFCEGGVLAEKMGIGLAQSGLKFRDRIVDHQLEEMALPPQQQKSEKEIQEEIYAKLKAEREELGMPTPTPKPKKGKKGKGTPVGVSSEISEDDLPPPEAAEDDGFYMTDPDAEEDEEEGS